MANEPENYDQVMRPNEGAIQDFQGALRCRDERAVRKLLEDTGTQEQDLHDISAGELLDVIECVSLLMARILRRGSRAWLAPNGSIHKDSEAYALDQVLAEVIEVTWEDASPEELPTIRARATTAIGWLHTAATYQPKLFPHVTKKSQEGELLLFSATPRKKREDDALTRWGYNN